MGISMDLIHENDHRSCRRIVVPKALREAIGLEPGAEIELHASDGRIELGPAPLEVRLERRGRLLVAVPVAATRPLSQAVVERTVAELRRSASGGDERFLPDTSCLVAAVCSWHEHHQATSAELSRRVEHGEVLVLAAPALVEAYAVLTRLSAAPPKGQGRAGRAPGQLRVGGRGGPPR